MRMDRSFLASAINVQNLHIASGGDRPTALYNLDVIISVGYRVKSKRSERSVALMP